MEELSKKKIEKAVDDGVECYLQKCKNAIDDFVLKYFSFKGTWQLHKKALGKDLYRVPLNIAWAVPYLVSRTGHFLLHKMGEEKFLKILEKIPPGFKTDVQKEVEWLIVTELLQLPYKQDGRESNKDGLLASILEQDLIYTNIHEALTKIGLHADDPEFKESIIKKMNEYGTSRTAVADLTGNILMLASGYVAFQKATPGAISGGTALATAVAQHLAISNSWWPLFYSFWYSLFPVTPTLGLVVASTGALMTGLAILTTFSGIVTDPLQVKLGIHQKRLKKIVVSLEKELKGKTKSEFKLRDVYVARIFDFMDILKMVSRLV